MQRFGLQSPLPCRRGFARAGLWLVAALLLAGCGERDSLESARRMQQAGLWRESAELLRRMVEEEPADTRLHLEYGKALLAIAEPTRAIWPLRRAAESPDLQLEAGVLLAQALLATSNAEDAIQAASAVLEVDDEHAAALFARSRAYVAAKRHDDALVDADLYVDLYPDNPQGRLLQLGILLTIDDESGVAAALADAAPLFDPAGPLDDPSKARFCMLDATFRFERGDRPEGEALAEGCLERFPDQEVAIDSAVSLFDRGEDPERGGAILRAALERNPSAPKLRLALATRLLALGDVAEAERLLEEGTRVLPGAAPWLALHDHYVVREEYAKAREAIEQAIALEPSPSATVLIAFADDLVLTGELERAEEVAAGLASPGREFVRGRILLARDEPAEALREIEEGLRLWPDNSTARWLAGQAAERIGNFPAAISHYRESVRADAARAEPARTPAARELADLYAAMGAGSEAIEFAQRHLEANPQDVEATLALLALSRRFASGTGRARAINALGALPAARGHFLAARAHELAARQGPEAGIALLEAQPFEGMAGEIHVVRALAELEREAGRPTAATARVRALLERRRDDVEGLLLLAAELERSEASPDERRALLERARALAPRDGAVLLARARLAVASGDPEAALPLFDAIPATAPEFASGRLESARVLKAAQSGNTDAAQAELEARLEEALRRDPRNAEAAYALARLLAASNAASDRALELARRATLLGAGAPAATLLGRLWLERGETQVALESLTRVTSAFPDHASAYYWLARAREAHGDHPGAREAYEHALEVGGLGNSERTHAENALTRLSEVPSV